MKTNDSEEHKLADGVPTEAAKAPAAAAKTGLGKLAGAAKKVPPVVWIGAVGGGLVLGFIALRRGESADAAEGAAEASSYMGGEDGTSYGMSEDGMSYIPAGVGVSTPVIAPPESAETVGAIGQTALETFGSFFTDIFGRQTEFDAEQQESWRTLIEKLSFAQPPRVPPNAHQPVVPKPTPVKPKPPAAMKPQGKPQKDLVIHGGTFKKVLGYADRGIKKDAKGKNYREFWVYRPDNLYAVWAHYDKGGTVASNKGWTKIGFGKTNDEKYRNPVGIANPAFSTPWKPIFGQK
jgi:hypothetical protein